MALATFRLVFPCLSCPLLLALDVAHARFSCLSLSFCLIRSALHVPRCCSPPSDGHPPWVSLAFSPPASDAFPLSWSSAVSQSLRSPPPPRLFLVPHLARWHPSSICLVLESVLLNRSGAPFTGCSLTASPGHLRYSSFPHSAAPGWPSPSTCFCSYAITRSTAPARTSFFVAMPSLSWGAARWLHPLGLRFGLRAFPDSLRLGSFPSVPPPPFLFWILKRPHLAPLIACLSASHAHATLRDPNLRRDTLPWFGSRRPSLPFQWGGHITATSPFHCFKLTWCLSPFPLVFCCGMLHSYFFSGAVLCFSRSCLPFIPHGLTLVPLLVPLAMYLSFFVLECVPWACPTQGRRPANGPLASLLALAHSISTPLVVC